eukprot:TRINITY_DN16807_c0_g1_i2.p1 TRINITY_DN16807_c0_g1~~TRINITY_DN16807_c0_g1_i2.p1  ORF type:complete len:678 (+),score=72.92 TRINITY_DN16807_c0_g1_i2:28-2034(+)
MVGFRLRKFTDFLIGSCFWYACVLGKRVTPRDFVGRSLAYFDLAVPPSVEDAAFYEGAIFNRLIEVARLAENGFREHESEYDAEEHTPEEACCIISKLPLLTRDAEGRWKAGPWGLAAIVAPASESNDGSKPRINLYRREALQSWYCLYLTDPVVGGPLRPSTQIMPLSDIESPLCGSPTQTQHSPSEASEEPTLIHPCEPESRARDNAELRAMARRGVGEIWIRLAALDDATIRCQDPLTGRTALHAAAYRARLDTVSLLLERLDDEAVGLRDQAGRTALHDAVQSQYHLNPEENDRVAVVHALLARSNRDVLEAKVFTGMYSGMTALHIAVITNKVRIVSELVDAMDLPTINMGSSDGRTALHEAVARGRDDMVKKLLSKLDAASLRIIDREGFTALHTAVMSGHRNVVIELLETREGQESLEILAPYGRTVLHVAVQFKQYDTVKLLLEKMDPQLINDQADDGHTALMYAVRGHEFQLLDHAGMERAESMIRELVTQMGNAPSSRVRGIGLCDRHRRTALHLAATFDAELMRQNENIRREFSERAIAILLDSMHDDEIKIEDFHGRTALHYAAKAGLLKSVELLLKRCDEAFIEKQDHAGATALHLAAQEGRVLVIDRLLSSWVSLDQVDENGATALAIANAAGHHAAALRLRAAAARRWFVRRS